MSLNYQSADGQDQTGQSWYYSAEVKEHFFKPKNFTTKPPEDYNGLGMVGSPACGDMLKVWIKVDEKSGKIKDFKWQTFGCASAIASTSALSGLATANGGLTLEEARKISYKDILNCLGGLPERKVHCSVLGDKALRSAINDYYRRTNQLDKVAEEGRRFIDKVVRVTDRDIEQAVLDGVKTMEELQSKTKIGTGDRTCLTEAEELLKFYLEKYAKV